MNLPFAAHRGASVTVFGEFATAEGYGSMNEYMVRGMARAGADVNPWPVRIEPEGLSDEFFEMMTRSHPHLDSPVVVSSSDRSVLNCVVGPELFVRQAWETDLFPPVWLPSLNRCRAIIATTAFVADVLRRSGVEVPVEVVPDGIDPEVHYYEPRPEREALTTLVVGRNDDRKHHREALAGWQRAFSDNPDARLIIKAFKGNDLFAPPSDDPRIQLIEEAENTRGLMRWYRQADVLLALGSEGTGLPMLEAMATGLPVIALASAGQTEVCAALPDTVLPVQPAGWQAPRVTSSPTAGNYRVPDVDEVTAHLRWVATHRDEAADMGRRASSGSTSTATSGITALTSSPSSRSIGGTARGKVGSANSDQLSQRRQPGPDVTDEPFPRGSPAGSHHRLG